MKLNGFVGKGSGKMGASVWLVRRGQQVVREYVSQVNNPKSEGQSRQRARFKLISQVTALLGPYVQNRPIGGETSRNAFARENAAAFSWDNANSRAVVDMLNLSLTSSSLGLPIMKEVPAARPLEVGLASSPMGGVDAVMYLAFAKVSDKYEFVGSLLQDAAGANGHYDGQIDWPSSDYSGVVYAYGIKWNSEDVRTLYQSYKSDPLHSASLILELIKNPSNATLTVTRTRPVTVPNP